MPIQRSTRPITLEEHAKVTAPETIPVTKFEAVFSTITRGGCLLVCGGIGVACLLSLGAFSGFPRILLAALATILILIGLVFAKPLPAILFAAMTGRERVIARTNVRTDALVETWHIPARQVFATTYGDDILIWLIETDDGEFLHIYGEEHAVDPEAAWIPGHITIQIIANAHCLDTTLEGPLVPYVWLSDEAAQVLSEPFVTGYWILDAKEVARLRPILEADAASHAAKHGTNPPAP
jgi:hypothetical protein